jgi:hypothetical protein
MAGLRASGLWIVGRIVSLFRCVCLPIWRRWFRLDSFVVHFGPRTSQSNRLSNANTHILPQLEHTISHNSASNLPFPSEPHFTRNPHTHKPLGKISSPLLLFLSEGSDQNQKPFLTTSRTHTNLSNSNTYFFPIPNFEYTHSGLCFVLSFVSPHGVVPFDLHVFLLRSPSSTSSFRLYFCWTSSAFDFGIRVGQSPFSCLGFLFLDFFRFG